MRHFSLSRCSLFVVFLLFVAFVVFPGYSRADGRLSGVDVSVGAGAGSNLVSVDHGASQWWFRALDLSSVHAAGFTGLGVRVGVIDTVIDAGHGDLAGQVVESWVLRAGKVRASRPGELVSSSGHGTHVSSIIAGNSDGFGVTGVAPDADLVVMEIPGLDGSEDVSAKDIVRALRYVAGRDVGVINLSLGFGVGFVTSPRDRELVCQAVGDVSAEGVVVVVSAGNSGDALNEEMFPASCPDAISVGAVDNELASTYWSSYDRTVSLTAPGGNISGAMDRSLGAGAMLVNFQIESHPVIAMDGTSMAAPVVAGVAALVRQANPGLSVGEVRDLLLETALDRGGPGFDLRYGFGVVDPAAALGLPGGTHPVASLDIKMQHTWKQTYFAWNVQDAEEVTEVTARFRNLKGKLLFEREFEVSDLRAFVPSFSVPGFWQLEGVGVSGEVFTSTRHYVAPEPLISPPPVDFDDLNSDFTEDGRVKLSLYCPSPLRESMSIHYSMEWDRPELFRSLMPKGMNPKNLSGSFSDCLSMPQLVLDPAEYRYLEDSIVKTGRLSGEAAAAVRQYAFARYSFSTFSVWARERGRMIGAMNSLDFDAQEPVRSWYVKDGKGFGVLHFQVDRSKMTSTQPRVFVSFPGGGRASVRLTEAGYGSVRVPHQSGPYAVFDMRSGAVEGLGKNGKRIYAFRTSECVTCKLGIGSGSSSGGGVEFDENGNPVPIS